MATTTEKPVATTTTPPVQDLSLTILQAGMAASGLISNIFGAQSKYLYQSRTQEYTGATPSFSITQPQGGSTGIGFASSSKYMIYVGIGIVVFGVIIFALRR